MSDGERNAVLLATGRCMNSTDATEQTNLADSANGVGSHDVASAQTATSEETDFSSLMEQFLSDPSHDYKSLKYGDVMDGTIMHVDRDELLVDIGSKSEG